jgi:hypothetical protein
MTNTRLVKLQELLMESPDDVFLTYALAMEYLGLKEIPMAEKHFKSVLNIDSTHVPAYFQLGLLYVQLDQENLAKEFLEMGIKHAQFKNDNKAIREIRAVLDELLYS